MLKGAGAFFRSGADEPAESVVSEQQIHAIREIHGLAIWRAGPDGAPLSPNAWTIDYGRNPQGVAQGAEGWLAYLHPADRERVRPLWREALRTAAPFEARYRLLHLDGSYRWSLGRGRPLLDAEGKVREWIGTVVDIEDSVAAENALAVSEERLRLALRSTALGIWDLDLAGGSLWCSDLAAAILGHGPEAMELDDAIAWRHLHGDDAERFHAARRAAIAGTADGALDLEFRIHAAAAEAPRWAACTARAIFDIHGRPVRMLGTLRDVTEKRMQQERLFHQAHYDGLTDLPNRRLVALQADTLLQDGHPVALLLLDIDGFKLANDTLGHRLGDLLLVQIARRLRDGFADSRNLVARLSGDKFALLAPDVTRPDAAAALAQRLQALLAEPFLVEGHPVPVGGSIGIALAPRDAASAQDLMRHADLALHDAKAAAPALTRFYLPRLAEEVAARQTMDLELRRAVEAGEFELHYQPQLSLAGSAVMGAEALLRWRHPKRGLLAPGAFFPVLERTATVLAVGDWVVRQAVADAAWLHAQGHSLRIAINLFAAQFRTGGVPDLLRAALAGHDLPPERLEIEVTENVILRNDAGLHAGLQEIRRLGCGIAFDDFGTGHASLSMLKRIPLTRLKIDRSFVADLDDSPEDCAIVDAILSLGRTFGLAVTAEGIETRSQAQLLHQHGCDEGQGYLFSRPVPLPALETFIRR
ncbi:putative bifunctional diguanylate cyclase/phosphodiesterase [Marinibaculum pumilum]|uniref:Bifunctional diguanylate cyclase/phosphodiesterase n=1 Tax=Marinibaculum pumilum TaxID=1766165 RepID=A0ABV7LA26_9PROT